MTTGNTKEQKNVTALEQGAVYLYWIPLGAGGRVVKTCGKIFEAFSAFFERRPRCDLYHTALEVRIPEGRYFIEQAPVWDMADKNKGVVAEGPVGMKWLGHFRAFRYEVRCWKDGIIPDISFAVGSPVQVTDKVELSRKVIQELPHVSAPVWGRDESHTGEMWNSNSVISWVLVRSGVDISQVRPPRGGRAPGWKAGEIVAVRDLQKRHS